MRTEKRMKLMKPSGLLSGDCPHLGANGGKTLLGGEDHAAVEVQKVAEKDDVPLRGQL